MKPKNNMEVCRKKGKMKEKEGSEGRQKRTKLTVKRREWLIEMIKTKQNQKTKVKISVCGRDGLRERERTVRDRQRAGEGEGGGKGLAGEWRREEEKGGSGRD